MKYSAAVFVLMLLLAGCSTTGSQPTARVDSEYKKILANQKQKPSFMQGQESHVSSPDLTPDGLERLGDRYISEGNIVMALVQYDKALRAKDTLSNVRYKMGRLFLAQGLKADALKTFEDMVRREPSNALGYYGKALVYLTQNDLETSRKNLLTATELDSTLWRVHATLGLVYDLQKQHGLAIEQHEKALVLYPRSAAVYNNLGVALYSKGDYLRSRDAFLAASKIEPGNDKICNNLALSLYMLTEKDKALEAFKMAGNEATAYHNIGSLLMIQQSYEESLKAFEKAIELKPSYYAKADEKLRRAKIAMEREK